MRSLLTGLYLRFAGLIAELAKFGLVGGLAAVVDLGGAGYLHGAAGLGPLSAKAISLSVAAVLSYLGNRFWTFRHRANHALLREWTVFLLLNAIGLVIAEATIGFTYYALGYHGSLAFNLASVAGTGLGTIFRFWSYKKWVFIAPETLTGDLPEQLPELAYSAGLAGPGTARISPAQSLPTQGLPAQSLPAKNSAPHRTAPRGSSSRRASSRSSSFRSGYAGAHRR
jgi:putative flippase GtrA